MLAQKLDDNIKQTFGSFFVSGCEFAIDVRNVHEVVNSPDHYTLVPLAPNFLKGLFNLRGVVIPVVDLKELLHLKSPSTNEDQKVAIVEFNGYCIGLLFDKTGDVFRSKAEERSDFDEQYGSEIIMGAFKKNKGKRIVQILDVTRLFKLQNIPRDTNHQSNQLETIHGKNRQKNQCISFVVGPAKCALPIADIQEILKVEKLCETVLSADNCLGAFDLRGVTVPVIDFRAFLKYGDAISITTSTLSERPIIVMRLENELIGLMVDAVDSIISYFPYELIAFPLLDQTRQEMFLGCITRADKDDIIILNHQKILSQDELLQITHGHSKLYQKNTIETEVINSKKGVRRTFITFAIDDCYAVAINEINEIIKYPSHLMHAPGLPNYIRGLLNLRGKIISIIDTRIFFSMSPNTKNTKSEQILVYTHNIFDFGLIVDGVESIASSSEQTIQKVPQLLRTSGQDCMQDHISGAIEVTDSYNVKKSALILDIKSISQYLIDNAAGSAQA